jgi:hypothetical protein
LQPSSTPLDTPRCTPLLIPELDTRGAVVATLELEAGVAEAGHGAPADLDAARPRDAVTLAHQLQGRLQRLSTSSSTKLLRFEFAVAIK